MLGVATVIMFAPHIFKQALTYQTTIALSPQDSIIYASVISDLGKRTKEEVKCFLSSDKKAFPYEELFVDESDTKDKALAKNRIRNALKQYQCRYISTFEDGLKFITSQV